MLGGVGRAVAHATGQDKTKLKKNHIQKSFFLNPAAQASLNEATIQCRCSNNSVLLLVNSVWLLVLQDSLRVSSI